MGMGWYKLTEAFVCLSTKNNSHVVIFYISCFADTRALYSRHYM